MRTLGGKELCGLTPKSKQEAAIARPLLDEYYGCLAAATTDTTAQLCTSCLPTVQSHSAAWSKACFRCLRPIFVLKLKPNDLSVRAGLCTLSSRRP